MGTLAIGLGRTLLFLTLIFTFNCTRLWCFRPGDDTLKQGDYLGLSTSLGSVSQVYKLHFFSFEGFKSRGKYLGIICFARIIWLANQNNPITISQQPKLIIDDYGSLKILQNNDTELLVLYSSQATDKINVSATLLDTGNFVLSEMNIDGTVKQILWQSYDHPQYILMPGMKLGFNIRTWQNWTLTSWTGPSTPTVGSFTLGVDPNDREQLVLRWQGRLYWTSGPLVDGSFPNLNPTSRRHNIYFIHVSNENETYFTYNSTTSTDFIGLNPLGKLYGSVSVSCSGDNPARVSGCVPQSFPACRNQAAYLSTVDFKFGNMSQQGYNNEDFNLLSLYDCGVKCMNNCSCYAYSSTTDDNAGCQMWDSGTKFVSSSTGQPIYFINNGSHINMPQKSKDVANIIRKVWMASVIVGALLTLVSSFTFYLLWRKRRIKEKERLKQKILCEIVTPSLVNCRQTKNNKIETTNHAMQLFSFESIESATDHFSSANKLGEGGFGSVYKGRLLDDREIAVKRLSRSSRQGLTEFKNEVKLIAKFQHTNLVKLHGFCIEREERMLIYEYMSNKSLDFYLFDSSKRILLDWKRRFAIIQGIAQGLVYLHTYSRLTVIHRDLKPSNILLDFEMNPKISDFGLARIFGLKEPEKNTNRIVGTYGYMSPEYALNGIVSTKLDVFSFGVLMLEIVSGKKNACNYDSNHPLNLIGYAWQLWNKGNALELTDPVLKGSCAVNEVLRSIHISLLCVQDQADDRPNMSDVISFLSSEAIMLAEPKQPAFFTNTIVNEPRCSIAGPRSHSLNNVTVSTMSGR